MTDQVGMKFIEMTGKALIEIVRDDELQTSSFSALGISDETVVRVNEHGDIEVRLIDRWDVIGGLLGNFEQRIKQRTGLEWVHPV